MYHAIFGNFMPISQVSMGGNVITNFDSQILYSIGKNIAPILLLLVPLIVTILCLAPVSYTHLDVYKRQVSLVDANFPDGGGDCGAIQLRQLPRRQQFLYPRQT